MSSRGKIFKTQSLFLPFVCAFFLWCIAFHEFLLGQRLLMNDAVSYFQETFALTDTFLRGIFPVWTNGYFGMPNDFFLLRLGAFNPFYLFMLALRVTGIPFLFVYLWSLAGYYFLGCYGFYRLCERLTGHRPASFAGFLLLYFSSLGTRIFDSFIILIFVPLMWFVFFLADFYRKPSRLNFLGMVFSAMILMSTYIPFYFLVIVLFTCVLFLVVFPLRCLHGVKVFREFFRREKVLSLLGVVAVLAAMLPGLLFFQASRRGDYVMSHRHHKVETDNAVEVHFDTTKKWAILEDVAFSMDFKDLRTIRFAVLYIPVLAWVIFVLGLFARFNRRSLFYLLFIGGFLALGIPQDLPVYKFFYSHIPVFSYFRNLHFFLWWAILPAFILLLSDQLACFLRDNEQGRWKNPLQAAVATIFHACILVMVLRQNGWMAGTVISLAGSWFLALVYIFTAARGRPVVWGMCLLAVVAVQPLEVYHFLSRNTEAWNSAECFSHYTREFSYVRKLKGPEDPDAPLSYYVALQPVQTMVENLGNDVFIAYNSVKVRAYDDVEVLPAEKQDWDHIQDVLAHEGNRAFVFDWDEDNRLTAKGGQPLHITGLDQGLDVMRYDPNRIVMRSSFDQPKFIVINEAFHPGWRCTIDGKPARLYQANIAFRGIYVPAGRHVVAMRFSSLLWLRYMIWIFYLGMFIVLVGTGITMSHQDRQDSKSA